MLYSVCVVFLVLAVFYWLYTQRIIPDDLPDSKLGEIERLVSNPVTGSALSYVHFSAKKKEGVLRIGCFGDSFTYGDEVECGDAYPSFLSRLYAAEKQNVEVINFGMSWQGFYQQYIIWDKIGSKYDLDIAVFGPACFQPERDASFCHARDQWEDQDVSYLHSKYVLKDGEPVRVDVKGESIKERVQDYFSFFPKWRYLKYDYYAPLLFNAPVRFFFGGEKELRNPFCLETREQQLQCYQILLSRIALSVERLLVVNHRKDVVDLANKIRTGSVVSKKMQFLYAFPYSAPGSHFSAIGNEFTARKIYAYLNDKTPAVPYMYFSDIDPVVRVQKDGFERSFNDYSFIEFIVDDETVGGVYDYNQHRWFPPEGTELSIKSEDVSLLILENEDSVFEPVFIYLPFAIEEGQELRLNMDGRSEVIGNVKMLNTPFPCGLISGVPYKAGAGLRNYRFSFREMSGRRITDNRNVTVSFDGTVLFEAGDEVDVFEPADTLRVGFARSYAGDGIDIDDLSEDGVLLMRFYDRSETPKMDIEIACWKKMMR